MHAETTTHLLLIVLLLGFSSFFSAAETALFSLSPRQLKKMIEAKGLGTKLIQRFQSEPKQVLTTILLGNDLINIAISILATGQLALLFPTISKTLFLCLSIGITTFVILLFGEIIPKNVAIRAAPLLAPLVVYPLQFFSLVTRPVQKIMLFISDRVIRLFGGTIGEGRRMIMEEEFRALVTMGEGVGENLLEKKLIDNIFQFSDRKASDFMTPKGQMVSLPVEATLDQLLTLLKKRRYSRIPIYEGQKNNILGLLYIKDLLTGRKLTTEKKLFSLRELLKPALFASPEISTKELLKQFQGQKMHMAILKNKEEVFGLVTLDDLLRHLLRAA
ncbi:MAG: hemolysin family protein [Deltaproteobacteria bacterium]|nr:hemolysin family protein [Deltaproteobacteria bacterium]